VKLESVLRKKGHGAKDLQKQQWFKPADERVRGLRMMSVVKGSVRYMYLYVHWRHSSQTLSGSNFSKHFPFFPFLLMSSFFFCRKRPLEFNRKYMAILMYVLCHSANCGHDNTRAYKQYFGRAVYEDNLLVSTGR